MDGVPVFFETSTLDAWLAEDDSQNNRQFRPSGVVKKSTVQPESSEPRSIPTPKVRNMMNPCAVPRRCCGAFWSVYNWPVIKKKS